MKEKVALSRPRLQAVLRSVESSERKSHRWKRTHNFLRCNDVRHFFCLSTFFVCRRPKRLMLLLLSLLLCLDAWDLLYERGDVTWSLYRQRKRARESIEPPLLDMVPRSLPPAITQQQQQQQQEGRNGKEWKKAALLLRYIVL